MNEADIYAMFERMGLDPKQREREEQLNEYQYEGEGDRRDGKVVSYRTVLSDGTGQSMLGGTDAKLEQDAR
ncbi:hypothetical protein ISN75_02600 [Dyella marensis]|uniref:hypothetical protein n=1 Tax=Dyella marensis TaxID=500610 RepID=UPI0031E3DDBA